MSQYTTELRFICENYAGLTESTGYENIDTVLESARPKVFDFDFPIFDEEYRNVLENKILKHYYTREIGAETVGLWKHWLCTRLNEIMPYYNQLYTSSLLEFNPLYDVDLTTNSQRVNNGDNSKSGTHDTEISSTTDITGGTETSVEDNNKNDHWEYFSNTPEGGINGVADLSYLTTALHTTDDATGSTSSTTTENNVKHETEETNNAQYAETSKIKNVEDYLHHVSGKSGGASYSKLLKEYRETFLNIDVMIINELADLFMNIW